MKRKGKFGKIDTNNLYWIVFVLSVVFVIITLSFWVRETDKEIDNTFRNEASLQNSIFLQLNKYKPLRKWKVEDFHLKAEGALSILVDNNHGNGKVLFAKNADQKLGIASLTKLMTAWIAIKNYKIDQKITFTQKDVDTIGEIGYFKAGESFFLKDLIYSLLGESSNDAASAISNFISGERFIFEMNTEANNLGLNNTFFMDATGLTEDDGKFNYSTANDLSRFIIFLLRTSKENKGAKLILKAMGTKEFKLFTADGEFHHKVLNTDKLLYSNPDVIAGKTGWTPLTQGCLITIVRSPKAYNGYLINVILGSPERFREMDELIDWDKNAYYW